MKKTSLFALAALPFTAFANPSAPMIDMSIDMMKQSGELARGADCLGISEAKFESGTRETMETCFSKYNVEQEDQLNQCMEAETTRRFKLSSADFVRCAPSDDTDPMDAYDTKMNALMDQMNKSGPTEAQMREINALQQKQMADGMAMMQKMGNVMQNASQNTENQITLPIYENSTILMHLTESMNQFSGNEKVLPAATFASPDEIQDIVDYYKKKLPNFAHKKLSGGEHIFMKNIPADFDILTHMGDYTSTPHVLISKAHGGPGPAANAKAMIEIAYKK